MRKKIANITFFIFVLFLAEVGQAKKAELTFLETSDLHGWALGYDYFEDKPSENFGLTRAAVIIKKIRQEKENVILVDDGDLIEGNPMADYFALVKPLAKGEILPIYKLMNSLKYDIATLGNHEFNYGLEYLKTALAGAKFPYICSNLFLDDGDKDKNNDKTFLPQYKIIEKKINGHVLKIGFLGFVPPQIMMWDSRFLKGKLQVHDILETAKELVPKLKKEGADLIMVLDHGGIGGGQYRKNTPDAVYHLAALQGVDAVFAGHSHQEFPGKMTNYLRDKAFDSRRGTIFGKPVVMPGYWGNNVGVISMTLEENGGKWKVLEGKAELRSTVKEKEDEILGREIKNEHEETLRYIRTPLGKTEKPLTSNFARVADSSVVQLINDAQMEFVKKKLQGTKYGNLPVLSAAAAFRNGFSGPGDFTNIPAGEILLKNIADVYIYANTIAAVKITGFEVKQWLEKSAENFVKVDPGKIGETNIINRRFKAYNFDVIDGITYRIDVTKPKGKRIIDVFYMGKPMDMRAEFIVATNNYRAYGGGGFPGLDGKSIVFEDLKQSRDIIIEYIKEKKVIAGTSDKNWSLAKIPNLKGVLYFETSFQTQEEGLPDNILPLKESSGGSELMRYNINLKDQ